MKHTEKISMTIDYIEKNLTKKLDLDMVAQAVNYSKYHLHRVFSKTLGMTMHDYLKRRQLTEAAKLLVFSKKSILDIALLAGYESQQAFNGVFKSMYKLSPKQYRENERFYPLQLKFEVEEGFVVPDKSEDFELTIDFAVEDDIPHWMDLVRLVIDGFPHMYEDEHVAVLKKKIESGEALIMKDGSIAVGIMLFSRKCGSIDFMGTHPFYRQRGIPRLFLNAAIGEMVDSKEISTTTYREGDKADTGHRRQVIELGFAEAELLTEIGYPTQRFILSREDINE